MYIESISVRNFRNYEDIKLNFDRDVNIFYGANAQGKTNLLEALAYLGLTGSFREKNDGNIVRWGENYFFIKAQIVDNTGSNTVSAGFQKSNKQKLWKYNENVCKKLSEVVGKCHVVFFLPDDMILVKRGPAYRRLFLDREMVQLFPGFHLYLNEYRRALQQRNELLRQTFSGANAFLFEAWEEKMAQAAAKIVKRRAEVVCDLAEIAARLQQQISNGYDELQLEYAFSGRSELAGELGPLKDISEEQLTEFFAVNWAKKREDDARHGVTQLGPHRDDLDIKIFGRSARGFGSQGQQRTTALALKLSEVELVKKYKGEYPVLLLDDVFSELDAARRDSLLNLMHSRAQVFITTTDNEFNLVKGKKWHITNGTVREDA